MNSTTALSLTFDASRIDLADETAALFADLRHAAKSGTDVAGTPIVEDSPLFYREGMVTEVRAAPRWGNAIAGFVRHLRALDRSPKTVYQRSYQLRTFSQAFRSRSPWDLTRSDVEAYMVTLARHGRSHKRSMLTAIRSFYKYGEEERMVTENPCRFITPIPKVDGEPRPAEDADIRAALDVADERAKLMIMLGAYCGLRVSEIARVHTDDVTPLPAGRYGLRVNGKGQRKRVVPLTPNMRSRIQDQPPGYLFTSWHRGQIDSDGKVHDEPLTAGHVGVLMRRALPPGVTPHTLRHRYASTVYAATRDIRAVQKALGHSSVDTTMVYTRVPEDSLWAGAAAAGELHY